MVALRWQIVSSFSSLPIQEDGEPVVQAEEKKKVNRRRAQWRSRSKRKFRQSQMHVSLTRPGALICAACPCCVQKLFLILDPSNTEMKVHIIMQSMTLRQFAFDETPSRAAHAIGEGREPIKQLSTFSRMRSFMGGASADSRNAHGEDHGSTVYGTMTLEQIMNEGLPDAAQRSHVSCLNSSKLWMCFTSGPVAFQLSPHSDTYKSAAFCYQAAAR